MKSIVNFILFVCALPKSQPRLGFALLKLGGGVADIRGSIGGTVFSRNRYGNYSRNRTIPVNPATEAQGKIRSIMSVVRNAWFNTLTADQRTAWANYAASVTVQNRLGESIQLTGWNHFCRSASALLYADEAIVADGPTELALPETDPTLSVAASAGTGNLSVTFDNTVGWANEDGGLLLVHASRGKNATINFFAGPYLVAGKVAGDADTPPTSPATIAAPFTLTAGQKVFVQCRILRADGRLSSPFRTSCTVGA